MTNPLPNPTDSTLEQRLMKTLYLKKIEDDQIKDLCCGCDFTQELADLAALIQREVSQARMDELEQLLPKLIYGKEQMKVAGRIAELKQLRTTHTGSDDKHITIKATDE